MFKAFYLRLTQVFKILSVTITSLIFIQCKSDNTVTEKPALLKASRQAPLGWVYLTIYQDSSFIFTLTGIRSALTKTYPGKVSIEKDSLFFVYADSVPKAGNKAIFNNKAVAFVNGEYPESLNINLIKLNTTDQPDK